MPDASSPESAVSERYSAAAQATEVTLCCPVDYDPRYLEAIPAEVIERDYGCGDPSRHIRAGDVVLDLGSGSGKICFIASQIVGAKGSVIGVDMNDEMLALAREAAPVVAERTGYANVEFRRGRIQDLALDLDRLETWLQRNPVSSAADYVALGDASQRLRREDPLIADGSVDIVVSNCVLNLVRESDKQALIAEIFRVLRRGGRIAISDIVSDEPVPEHLKGDPTLWSGCVSGAFQEQELLRCLEEAGFHGIAIESWVDEPFAVVEGIEFRSVTVTAHKGKQGPCFEANQAVVYRGPWKRVEDDDGHVFVRGERAAVCAKTFGIMTRAPYADDVIGLEPAEMIPGPERAPFDCSRTAPRAPHETKRGAVSRSVQAADPCAPGGSCC
jgi:ubiquinone/menaquinone biosynthesis C-methylase UbiE